MKIIGVLGVMPEDLHRDLESFGLFFEDMAVRDLKVEQVLTQMQFIRKRQFM